MQEEPLLGHSGKDSAADDTECVSFEQPLSTTTVHSMGHPKHASCYTTAEREHHLLHHDEPQTHLLEADRQQDVAAPPVPSKVSIQHTTFIVILLSKCVLENLIAH